MEAFGQLIAALEQSNKSNDKISALVEYFKFADSIDKPYVIALFTGKKPKRTVPTALMRKLAIEYSGIPDWLFQESYQSVGDLSETIALILPPPNMVTSKPLHQWMRELANLASADEVEKSEYVLNAWKGLSIQERFLFNKLISGNFRIGISSKMLVNALAQLSNTDSSAIMHSIMGKWDPSTAKFEDLLDGNSINSDQSWPYPFCLAHPLEQVPKELGSVSDWQAEWKWDGIRGQIVKRKGELFIWSRGEELVTEQFPEIVALSNIIPDGTVIDGEILVIFDGKILPFSSLQQRLNRKSISKKQLTEIPVGLYAYDLLEFEYQDIRQQTLLERREKLELLLKTNKLFPTISLSPKVSFDTWEELADLRSTSRSINSEGIMLKHKSSVYHSGRKRGDWWKWKVNPYTIDTVMIYAQKGSGRRANHYTDYTFAVKDGEKLVTIAKAYSGLTDREIKEINSFVNKNAIEKFGPVRTVKPELVFEIAFEGIAESKRHKAGIALRFPRILRWRKDKTANDINTIQDLQSLLQSTLTNQYL